MSAPLIPDADEAREWAERELADPAYDITEPTPLDRASRAVAEAIGRLFSGEVPGDIAPLITVIVLIGVVSLVVIGLLIFGRPRARARARTRTPAGLFGGDATLSAADLDAEAQRAATAADWDAAIIAAVRALAKRLEERGIVETPPGATVHAFARAAALPYPDARDALQNAADAFDDVRYLRRRGTEDAYNRVRELSGRLHGAPVGVR